MIILQRIHPGIDAGLSALRDRIAKKVLLVLHNPSTSAFIFSLKTCGAAILALYLAFWLGLDQPKWALMSVFIVSQPDSGLVLAKSVFRMLGTAVGTLVTIALVFAFSQNGELFLASLAIWIGLCNFAARSVRHFAAYGFLLAGYTAAIIGIPAALNPAGAYAIILARCTEISLGILCAGLVSRLVLPRELLPNLVLRICELARRVERFAAFAGTSPVDNEGLAIERIGLFKDFAAVEAMRSSACYESAEALLLDTAMRGRIDAALHVIFVSVEVFTFGAGNAPAPEPISHVVSPGADTKGAPFESGAAFAGIVRVESQRALEDALARLRYLEAGSLQESIVDAPRSRTALWSDPGYALLTGLRSALAIVITSAFWFITAWPHGPTAVIAAANACSLIGGMQRQTRVVLALVIALLVAAVPVFATEFYLLPAATDFLSLTVALAPFLLTCGFAMATQPIAVFPITYFVIGSNLSNTMNYDSVTYLNNTLAIFFGFGITFLLFAVLLPESPERLFRRFRRHLLIHLAQFSDTRHSTLQEFERALFDHVAVTINRATLQSAASDCLTLAVSVVPVARAINTLRRAIGTNRLSAEIVLEITSLFPPLALITPDCGPAALTRSAWHARQARNRALARARLTTDVDETEALRISIAGCEALRLSLLRARVLMQDSLHAW